MFYIRNYAQFKYKWMNKGFDRYKIGYYGELPQDLPESNIVYLENVESITIWMNLI